MVIQRLCLQCIVWQKGTTVSLSCHNCHPFGTSTLRVICLGLPSIWRHKPKGYPDYRSTPTTRSVNINNHIFWPINSTMPLICKFITRPPVPKYGNKQVKLLIISWPMWVPVVCSLLPLSLLADLLLWMPTTNTSIIIVIDFTILLFLFWIFFINQDYLHIYLIPFYLTL